MEMGHYTTAGDASFKEMSGAALRSVAMAMGEKAFLNLCNDVGLKTAAVFRLSNLSQRKKLLASLRVFFASGVQAAVCIGPNGVEDITAETSKHLAHGFLRLWLDALEYAENKTPHTVH